MKAFIREAFVFLVVMAIIPFLATVVVLVAGAMGFPGLESLALISVVGIFALIGLFAGALSVWAKLFGRRG